MASDEPANRDDAAAYDEWLVRQTTWHLMAERTPLVPAVFDAWNELGAALAHDRWLRLEVTRRRDRGDPAWEWRITRRQFLLASA